MHKKRGYTLIEILIVIFIMSIVTSVALLSINHNENKQLETFAKQLTETLTLAEEQAILQPAVLKLSVQGEQLQFSQLMITDKKSDWTPLADHVLQNLTIPNAIEVNLQNKEEQSHIIISENGDFTPFTIYIAKRGKKPRYLITGDADGNVTRKALS